MASCNPHGTYGPRTVCLFLSKLRTKLSSVGLGSSPFARHYLGNHYCFLFLWLLRCFSSPGPPPKLKV